MSAPRSRWRLYGLIAIAVVLAVVGIAYLTSGASVGDPFDASAPYLVYSLILVSVLLGSLIAARPNLGDVGRAVLGWGAIFLLLVAGYAYRDELQTIGNRTLAALIPGYSASDGPGKEISIYRNADGHFRILGAINGASVTFLVDTGATSTTLAASDAQSAGLNVARLHFSVPVSTANGRTTVALTRLDSLTLGGLSRRDFPAYVSRPGSLRESLLGMDFLQGLSSWRVAGDRLILTP